MLNPLVRRTWAPRGKTPVIQVFKPHERISVVGAMTLALRTKRFGFQFHLLPDNANFCGEDIVDFIKGIRRKLRGNIILLWDMIEIHRATPVMNCVAKHQTVRLEYFPPYAPELNPVDQIWSYVKYGRLANYCPDSLTELRERITAEFSRLKERPDLLASFFHHTSSARKLWVGGIKKKAYPLVEVCENRCAASTPKPGGYARGTECAQDVASSRGSVGSQLSG